MRLTKQQQQRNKNKKCAHAADVFCLQQKALHPQKGKANTYNKQIKAGQLTITSRATLQLTLQKEHCISERQSKEAIQKQINK